MVAIGLFNILQTHRPDNNITSVLPLRLMRLPDASSPAHASWRDGSENYRNKESRHTPDMCAGEPTAPLFLCTLHKLSVAGV